MAHKPRILVIDDDESILEFIAGVLNDEGYQASTATNGEEGLEAAAQAPPDLILLDMRMPVMDGWQFAEAYHRRPGRRAPIIVITAARDAASSAEQIGAQGYLAKPFDLEDLLALVSKYVRPV